MSPEAALSNISAAACYLTSDLIPKALDRIWQDATEEQQYDWLEELPQDMKDELAARWFVE